VYGHIRAGASRPCHPLRHDRVIRRHPPISGQIRPKNCPMPDGPSTSRKERRGRQAARATNFKFQKRPMKRTKLNQIKVNKGPGGLPSAQVIRHGQMGRAFSPRFWLGTFLGALPQAGMVRAFGPCPWDEQAQQPPNHIISHQFPAFLDQKKLRCLCTAIRPTRSVTAAELISTDLNRIQPI